MKNKGFTLIELMIVVSMIAILAGASVPIYHGYVDKASLSEAKGIITEIAAKAEPVYVKLGDYGLSGTPVIDTIDAYTRSPQIVINRNGTEVEKWNNLGFKVSINDDLFGGPVYYRYHVAHGNTICARRALDDDGTTQRIAYFRETMSLKDDHVTQQECGG